MILVWLQCKQEQLIVNAAFVVQIQDKKLQQGSSVTQG